MPYGPGSWETTQPHEVTSKLEEWLIHQRAGFPFRRTSTNWRNKLAGASWSSTKANVKSCMGVRRSPWARLGSWSLGPAEQQLLTTWRDSREGLLRQGTRVLDVQGETGVTDLFSLGMRRPRQDIIAVFCYFNALAKTNSGFSQRHTAKEKKAIVIICNKGNTDGKYGKKSSQWDQCITETGAQRGCSISTLGDFQKLARLGAAWPDFEARPALSRRLDYRPPDVPFNLIFSVNLQHKIHFPKILNILSFSHKCAWSFVRGQQNWPIRTVTYLHLSYYFICKVIRLSVINYLIAYISYSDCHDKLRYIRLDSPLLFLKNVRFNCDREEKKTGKLKLFSSEQWVELLHFM